MRIPYRDTLKVHPRQMLVYSINERCLPANLFGSLAKRQGVGLVNRRSRVRISQEPVRLHLCTTALLRGGLAQMVERPLRMREVGGSMPPFSTFFSQIFVAILRKHLLSSFSPTIRWRFSPWQSSAGVSWGLLLV